MIYEPDPDDTDQADGQDAAGDDVAEVRITYGCTDPEQYRHLSRYGDRARPPNPTIGPIPEGEDEQGRAEREARQAQENRDVPPADPAEQGC